MAILTPRWEPLRYHPVQQAYWSSPHRFNVVPAGRRSGKTELAKRKLVKRALRGTPFEAPRFFAAAPTRDQAKRIFWEDLKALVPKPLMRRRPYETDLMIALKNGAQLWVVGMDKPERVEGSPWDGGVLDEYGNMREDAWENHVGPALADRQGWCDFIGVPEGRNHYYRLDNKAKAQLAEFGENSEWGSYHWISADIVDPKVMEQYRRDFDDLTFQQEFEATFISFEGRAYYPFLQETHCAPLAYDANRSLIFCFDFNVAPGVAAVIQEQRLPNGLDGTGVIGEVHIPRNSTTPAVCRRLIEDWGEHRGHVHCFGDATGGSPGSAQVAGSDWDLIKAELRPVFGERLHMRVPRGNPPQRARVNAVNTRLKNTAGEIRLMVDPAKAPNVVIDFDGVRLLKGGSGEIDKGKDQEKLTHLSDAVGYYVHMEFPLVSRTVTAIRTKGH